MRLIIKITFFYLLIALIVFIAGYTITFNIIKEEIVLEQQRFLVERLKGSVRFIERRNPTKVFQRDKVQIVPLGKEGEESEIVFSDTLVMHSTLQRMELHTKLDVVKKVEEGYYKITLFDLIVEEDDIQEGVGESLLKVYLLLFLAVIILSGFTSYLVLKPFNSTLEKIKNFRLDSARDVSFGRTTTKEFKKLNSILEEMMSKMKRDYQALKEFTQNASHELQTPLGIMSGKLELLLESKGITDEQAALVLDAQNTLQKLSGMNRALLVLTKIENEEFSNQEDLDISACLESSLDDIAELLKLHNIELTKKIDPGVVVSIDRTLFDMIVSNLLQNAIRHNVPNGSIAVTLQNNVFTVENPGGPLPQGVRPEEMFERFKKGNNSIYSNGLGLAIVKKICDINSFKLSYLNKETRHIMSVFLKRP